MKTKFDWWFWFGSTFSVVLKYTRSERALGRARVMLFSRQQAARCFFFKKDLNDRALNNRRGAFFAPAAES
jgi:hypothetical protein